VPVGVRPEVSRDVEVDPLFDLDDSATDDIAHLVCCRDVSWRVAFCGAQETTVSPNARVVCSMCVDEANRMRPGVLHEQPPVCPVDGNACPPQQDIDARIDDKTR
jgi:hypothetical protein